MNEFLTAEQVGLLKKSFRNLDADAVAARFYKKLFDQHPEVKPMFPADMSELQSKLMSVFELVVFSFEEKQTNQYALQDSVIAPLRELGKLHDGKGVKPEHYPIANNLLLLSLQEESGDFFTSQVQQAWLLALHHLSDAMLNPNMDRNEKTKSVSVNSLRQTLSSIIGKLKKKSNV